MKKIFYLCCILFVCTFAVKAQTFEDAVYLKNGTVLHGIIIEQIPNQSIKIQTRDGNIFVYNLTEVEKISKEQVKAGRTSRNEAKEESIPVNPDARKLYPGVSFALSFVIPGAGQVYNGQKARGGIMLGLGIASMTSIVVGYPEYNKLINYAETYDASSGSYIETDYDGAFVALFLVGASVYVFDWMWSWISAPVSAGRINRRNGLSYNYKLNKNIDIALKPDYSLFFAGNNNISPTLGAKLSFNLH